MDGRVVIVSGPCGAGKSTVSRLLAEQSDYEASAHFHTDDFYSYICKGYIAPWLEDSGDQNEVVMEAIAASAQAYCRGGYEVFVDGMIGPWFLPRWLELARTGTDVRYIVLRPEEEATLRRAMEREKREEFPLTEEAVRQVWSSMSDLGEYEAHVLDTGGQTVEETVRIIQKRLACGEFRLSRPAL